MATIPAEPEALQLMREVLWYRDAVVLELQIRLSHEMHIAGSTRSLLQRLDAEIKRAHKGGVTLVKLRRLGKATRALVRGAAAEEMFFIGDLPPYPSARRKVGKRKGRKAGEEKG